MRIINLLLISLALFYCNFTQVIAAVPILEKKQKTMKTASQFMLDKVSHRGGFVWFNMPDFSRL